MCSICLDASLASSSDSLICPPASTELTFAPPFQMQKLPPWQAASFTHILCMPPLRGCRSDGEKQLQKIWPAGGAQGCDSSENRVGALIISTTHHHHSLSLLLSPNTIGGHPLLLFLSYLPSSIHFFLLPNPMTFQCILPAPARFQQLVREFSTTTEVSQMKPCARSPDHSPQSMPKPDIISTTVLPPHLQIQG